MISHSHINQVPQQSNFLVWYVLYLRYILIFEYVIIIWIQAKANPIIVTAGSAEKLAMCEKLGATVLINYKEGSFVPKVLEATNKKGELSHYNEFVLPHRLASLF